MSVCMRSNSILPRSCEPVNRSDFGGSRIHVLKTNAVLLSTVCMSVFPDVYLITLLVFHRLYNIE